MSLYAIKKLCRFNSNVSSHYFIKKNGEVIILVPELYKHGMQENQIGKIINL